MSIIHDVAYDHYGHRVATCSSDQTIRIYDSAGNKTAEWRAHSGSIWRLSWAHPEFGVALASCSFDRRICIWEENVDAEEAALLKSLARHLADSHLLVTYNGKSFDWPQLRDRFTLYAGWPHDSWHNLRHLDLLHPARRRQKQMKAKTAQMLTVP